MDVLYVGPPRRVHERCRRAWPGRSTNAFGLQLHASFARDDDPQIIEHAEMRWPGGGGIMFGTAGKDDSPFGRRKPGNNAVYDEDAFRALLTDWNEVIVANDPDGIGAFAEPDWVFVGENGILSGEQFLESVATGRVSHDFMTSELHGVRVYGDVAVVIARVRNSGAFEGNPFALDEWSTDVFVRRGDGWRCAITHLTSAATGPGDRPRPRPLSECCRGPRLGSKGTLGRAAWAFRAAGATFLIRGAL